MPFEWLNENEQVEPVEVVLDAGMTEALVSLMAQAMVAIVRAVEEAPDER